jgi:hypothetical protein
MRMGRLLTFYSEWIAWGKPPKETTEGKPFEKTNTVKKPDSARGTADSACGTALLIPAITLPSQAPADGARTMPRAYTNPCPGIAHDAFLAFPLVLPTDCVRSRHSRCIRRFDSELLGVAHDWS